MTKRIAAAALALIFSLVLFVVPAGAYDPIFLGFNVPDVGELDNTNYMNGLNLGPGSTVYIACSADLDCLAFCYDGGNNRWEVVYVSQEDGFAYWKQGNTKLSYRFNTADPTTGLYYVTEYTIAFSPTSYPSPNLPVFSSFEAGMSAASMFFNYESQPNTAESSFSIPAGYVAYIELEDPTQEIRIDATMPKNSAVLGQWWINTTTIKDGASYPTAGTSFPTSGSSRINWMRNVTGGTNILGQTKQASFIYQPEDNLIEIYNPYHFDGSVGDPLPNPTLYVTVTGLAQDGVRIYALADEISIAQGSLGIGSSSPIDFDDYWTSDNTPPSPTDPVPDTPTPITSWKDKDDNPTPAPSTGGYNEPMDDESIRDILQNFFKGITGLFTEGHDAIRNLSESASQFVSRLSSLYSWLPPQVLGVLTSAIILAIIIGVLKVFL